VLLALFIVTLATLLITDLFWRQFVLFRTVENQQRSAQSRLLLNGALEWARVILLDQTHPSYDTLSDPWAQPLAQTPLNQMGDTGALVSQATIEGGIEDGQSRFNLRNLVGGAGQINVAQLAALDKLAGLLGAPTGTARLIAGYVAQSYQNVPQVPTSAVAAAANAGGLNLRAGAVPLGSGTRPLPPVLPEDLAGIPGMDPAAAQALVPFVILLDQPNTAVNFNTASPQVMAAVIPDLGISDANALAAERDRAYFVSVGDIQNRLHGRGGTLPLGGISTNSSYFVVRGTIRLEPAATRMRALLRRSMPGAAGRIDVLWEREE
jgi:general secretion pathway protein K